MTQNSLPSVSYRQNQPPAIFNVLGKRLDDRGFEEFRPAFLKSGALSQSKGSAYAELGTSKVMVGVSAPRQNTKEDIFSRRGIVRCDVRHTTFSTLTRSKSRQGESDKEASNLLQAALEAAIQLEAFPRATIEISCLVMESGGSDISVLITAASLALADAGIPMFDLVTACSICRLSGQLLLDPTLLEAERQSGSCLLAMMPSKGEVTQLVVTGEWGSSELKQLLELACGGCMQLDASLRQTLLESCPATP